MPAMVEIANFKLGKKHGQCAQKHSNRTEIFTDFNNGLWHGEKRTNHPDGRKEIGIFQFGKRVSRDATNVVGVSGPG